MPPPVTSGLVLHLDASTIVGLSDGDPVATWPDESGLGNDATQAVAAARPTYETGVVNGLPVVRFADDGDGLDTPVSVANPFTIMYTCYYNGASAFKRAIQGDINNYLLGPYNAQWQWYVSGFATALGSTGDFWVVHGVVQTFASGTHFLKVDGAATVEASKASPGNIDAVHIAGAASNAFGEGCGGADIGEILVYNIAVDATQRADLISYLEAKWVTPATVPSAPTNPAAAALSASAIRVTWDDVADETGFRVERSPDGVGSWMNVSGNLAADTVLYDDTGLTASTQYFYRVIAFNAVGDSSPSSTVNATTSAASANRMGGTGAIRKPPRYSR